ncbi:MAG: AEC family transporter [Candidatus Omnitrophica bacterium]|nr:AEC family transporter [Candidatus Omnitrophota bacterium]
MPLITYSRSIAEAMLQMFFLGAVGFFLMRKKAISPEGLTGLTRFLIEVTMPALIFCSIINKFNFKDYSNWWQFTLLGFATTGLGLGIGYFLTRSEKDPVLKKEFISLLGFQNSGYLPLVIISWIVAKEQLSAMLIYLFMFVVGFDLLIWSWGVYFLSCHKSKHFSFGSVFTPPIIATLTGFAFIILKINAFIPKFIFSPLTMLGNCSFPLAIVVVGASLADLYVNKKMNKKLIFRLVSAKLILMPLIGLALVSYIKLPYLLGLLIVMELAVPSATNLAVIVRRYIGEETFISQGIFVTHLLSLLTLPLFLAAFNWIVFHQ